ncbi:MAG TPA: acyl carrier protein [Candidatus Acidoferrales bacterium]|nr:acyl carrier protein [Candidatus Acidoferrales bacterium]
MTLSIVQKIQRIAADLFQVPAESITVSSSPESIPNWDSVQQLNLILAVEQEFNVQFEPEELDRMHSIGDIISQLQTKSASQS